MINVYAAVAQEERRMISDRTKAGLAAAKARGVKLGGPRLPSCATQQLYLLRRKSSFIRLRRSWLSLICVTFGWRIAE
jgi:DNA invertase Pin-like site-specific DNA recombinase